MKSNIYVRAGEKRATIGITRIRVNFNQGSVLFIARMYVEPK